MSVVTVCVQTNGFIGGSGVLLGPGTRSQLDTSSAHTQSSPTSDERSIESSRLDRQEGQSVSPDLLFTKTSIMVLLAAAVCSRNGSVLVSRQFVEMTRGRIEGLLAAFPKLMTNGAQHTFVETESVRFVYQPMDQLYMLLITTKTSNILEDLETLRLFAKVIPEYCRCLTEYEVCENAFQLISAFDEVIALGYRENVNLSQIRTFTQMDSLEEREFIRQRKEREAEARRKMKEKAKEIGRDREFARHGGYGGYSSSSHYSSGHGHGSYVSTSAETSDFSQSHSYASSRQSAPPPSGRALKLGQKRKTLDSFMDRIQAEGGDVNAIFNGSSPQAAVASQKGSRQPVGQADIFVKLEEKLMLTAGRDSGLQTLDIRGIMHLNVRSADSAYCRLVVDNNDDRSLQFQTHPNVDKKLFSTDAVIGLKQAGKSFPLNVDVPVLKWRFVSSDESQVPLSINCWPSENYGRCEVNIEYELQQVYLELHNVVISIPCPSGVGAPTVENADGEYSFDQRHSVLSWRLPFIDSSNKSGSMEFSMPGRGDDFFPVSVTFSSPHTFCHIAAHCIQSAENVRNHYDFSQESQLIVEKYTIE